MEVHGRRTIVGLLLPAILLVTVAAFAPQSAYERDIAFALDELEKRCGHFFASKSIDWSAVRAEFTKSAKTTKSDGEHLVQLVRLLARLEDGHSRVLPLAKGESVQWPKDAGVETELTGVGLTRIGTKLYVRKNLSTANVPAGSELVSVDGVKAATWFEKRAAAIAEFESYSTPHHREFSVFAFGLSGADGATLRVEVVPPGGRKNSVTLQCSRKMPPPRGPAVVPADAKDMGDGFLAGTTPKGFGYLAIPEIPGDLPERLDAILERFAASPGLILDFRGNKGGGCDHDAVLARFIPLGHTHARKDSSPIQGAGKSPYGGPIVVLVDGLTVSAAETVSGTFKEDGRGYMLGESPTAGMSGQKEELELPSGLFALRITTQSNKGRFNGGKGVEGIGVPPHEIVAFTAKDLANGVDSVIARAEAVLAKFPQGEVPYDPEQAGWKRAKQ
ncbi:MAG: hypothetical protein JNL94_14025 [Planctomycetes bacterium]|nr:hypothetical protein [Planctomycetota bacterium]